MSDINYAPEVVRALLAAPEFKFRQDGSYLKGTCPQCNKKSLFISTKKPWRLHCNHANQCGYSEAVRDAMPEIFEDFLKRFPATPQNRKATADAYLALNRGFDLSLIRGWYEQGSYPLKDGSSLPTVRFYLDRQKTRFWERIMVGAGNDGQKAHFGGSRKEDDTFFKGDVWAPPGLTLERGQECYITEGIFHAIALAHAGVKAVAAFSCNHYPATFLEAHAKIGIKWVWALDSDNAGREWMERHHKTLKEKGELSSVSLLPPGKDWDDVYRDGSLTSRFLSDRKFHGRLFLAENVEEKAYIYYTKKSQSNFILDFKNAYYSIELGDDWNDSLEKAITNFRDAATITREKKKPEEALPDTPTEEKTEEPEKITDFRTAFLLTPDGRDLFRYHAKVSQISNVLPRFLYISKDYIQDKQLYVFSVDYANGQPQDIIELEGTAITKPEAFNTALLNKARGGTFDGAPRHLKKMRSWWLDSHILTVNAFPYIGHHKETGAYIFHDCAWHKGRRINVNPQGYFTINRQGIRSSLKGLTLHTKGEFSPDWIEDYAKAFSKQGMVLLGFFLGSLFAQQIREIHKSFPFLEFTGDPGSGKSTALEFLWKCLGRDSYEGFDLLKATGPGRRRAFSQVSNLPVVVIESDRDNGEKDAKHGQFSFDEMKPFFNGRGTGTLGVATRGNETDESFFQGALVISQNAEVDGSQALLERIVHCHADKSHFTPGSQEISRWFERQTVEDVSGFLHAALSREAAFLENFQESFLIFEKVFLDSGVKNLRVAKNHAQVAACVDCLRLIFPKMTSETVKSVVEYLKGRALVREKRLKADHPILEAFWDAYDYINTMSRIPSDQLNHASDHETTIAINLSHFREKCVQHGQGYTLDMALLKRLLPHTKRHKFIESNRAVTSRHESKTLKCWIFEKRK